MLNGEKYYLIIQSLIKLELYNKTSNSAHHVSHQCKHSRTHSMRWKEGDLFHAHVICSPTSLNHVLQIQAVFSHTQKNILKNEQVQSLKVMHH